MPTEAAGLKKEAHHLRDTLSYKARKMAGFHPALSDKDGEKGMNQVYPYRPSARTRITALPVYL